MLNNKYISDILLKGYLFKKSTIIPVITDFMYSDIVLLTGVGYRVELIERKLRFDVGFSHYVTIILPKDIMVEVDPSGTRLTVKSNNKQLLGDMLKLLIDVRKRNPYTGSGIVIISTKDKRPQLKSTKSDKGK